MTPDFHPGKARDGPIPPDGAALAPHNPPVLNPFALFQSRSSRANSYPPGQATDQRQREDAGDLGVEPGLAAREAGGQREVYGQRPGDPRPLHGELPVRPRGNPGRQIFLDGSTGCPLGNVAVLKFYVPDRRVIEHRISVAFRVDRDRTAENFATAKT